MRICFLALAFIHLPSAALGNGVKSQRELQSACDTIRAEYKLPAEIDPRVMEEIETELWAEVTRPCELSATPLPLILFMHGYHDSCGITREDGLRVDTGSDYGFTGNCSDPTAPEVVPQHQGYRYVADVLGKEAVVVSINTNRGLIGTEPSPEDDPALIMARGRLFLKHIEQLAKWNSGQEETPQELEQLIPLKDQIDFDNIGLMGHSRGGEGARAAVYQYNMPDSIWPEAIGSPANFKAIYEITPQDGSVPNLLLNASGLAWYVVLGGCDGDLINQDGMNVFDRAFYPDVNGTLDELPKGSLLIAGADHAGFNTEWQSSESKGCIGVDPLFNPEVILDNSHEIDNEKEIEAEVASPNPDQTRIVILTMVPFFRMSLMGELSEGQFMNPAYPLPDDLTSITFYERGYLRAPPQHHFETGLQTTGVRVFDPARADPLVIDTETIGVMLQGNYAFQFGPVHEQLMRMSKLFWTEAPSKYATFLFSVRDGVLTESIKTLAFRVALGCGKHFCDTDVSQVPAISVSVCLVVREGQTLVESTEVNLNSLVTLRRPTGPIAESRKTNTWYPPSLLQTVAVPMDWFLMESDYKSDLDFSTIHGIRVKIETEYPGELFLGQIIADDKTWDPTSESPYSPPTSESSSSPPTSGSSSSHVVGVGLGVLVLAVIAGEIPLSFYALS